MNKKFKLTIAILFVFALSACTTTPRKSVDFNPSEKVDNSESSAWAGTHPKQNQQFVNQEQLFGYLKTVDYSKTNMIAAEKDLKISKPFLVVTLGSILASGFANNLEDQGKILGVGVISWLAGFYFHSSHQNHVDQAIQQHNQHVEFSSR